MMEPVIIRLHGNDPMTPAFSYDVFNLDKSLRNLRVWNNLVEWAVIDLNGGNVVFCNKGPTEPE
jgi:hypothetical protein